MVQFFHLCSLTTFMDLGRIRNLRPIIYTPGVCTSGFLHLLALAPFNRSCPSSGGANKPHPDLLVRCPRPSSGASHPLAAAVTRCRRHRSCRFHSSGAPCVFWQMIQLLPWTWCNRAALRAHPRRPSGASHPLAAARTLCRRRISCRFRSSGGPCTSSSVNAARKQTSSGAGWTISSLTQVSCPRTPRVLRPLDPNPCPCPCSRH